MLGNRFSQHSFAQIPDVNIQRSQFDRSFTVKDTFDFDYLVPMFVDEILPGDTARVNTNLFARLATQKVPIMDNMMIDFFYFFVPNRLVWNNWEKFMGAQDNPGDSTDFIIPQIVSGANTTDYGVGTIYDKYGIPAVPTLSINALPFRAYNLIYNAWFRDENLQNSITVPKDNGPDPVATYALKKRGKRHDYFTSALPWPQKGPAVTLPLGTSAPVIGIGKNNATFAQGTRTVRESTGTTRQYTNSAAIDNGDANMSFAVEENPSNAGWPYIRADLSNATAATINQLRQAFSIQAMYELDARGGTRYVEILRAHFNVVSPDFRLQRPEYLGGGTIKINSHPVAQTSQTDTETPQANLAAFATASSRGENIGFSKSFVEHGYVIGLMAARADLTYQQGLNKLFSRSTRFDFFFPKLQELGEQAILNKEIYAQGTSPDNSVFGYQERYAEYRFKPSEIHGQFRSTYAQPLDMWHLAQKYASLPSLNSTFIESSTPIERAIAVTSEPDLLIDIWHQYKHARPMMTYSVPSTLGRF